MRAIIAGGTGFIGQALVGELRDAGGGRSWFLSRSPGKVAEVFGSGVIGMRWESGDWSSLLGPDTTIVNLAGENIARRGDGPEPVKERIFSSRVNAGRALVRAVREAGVQPGAFVPGVGRGLLRAGAGSEPIDETAESGTGFLAEVCRAWEASSAEL